MFLLLVATHAHAADEGALDTYLDARLDVIEAEVSTVLTPAYDGSGRFWFVVDRQGTPLDTIRFAERTGDLDVASRARARLRRRRGAVTALFGLALAGTTTALVGPSTCGLDVCGSTMFLGGLATGVGGFVGGTIAASHLVWIRHPSTVYTQEEATERVRIHNTAIRDEILGPDDPHYRPHDGEQ